MSQPQLGDQSQHANGSSRRSPFSVWLLGAAVLILIRLVGGFVPLTDATGWLWITRIGETWVVAGIVAWALADLPMKEIVRSMGRGRTLAVAGLIGLMFAGQYLELEEDTYPFVNWNMYTASVESVTFGEVLMILPGGETEPLPLRHEAQVSKEPRAISDRLLMLATEAAEGDEGAATVVDETLTALTARLAPPLPESIAIRRCTVTEPTARAMVGCETVLDVDVRGSGR